MNQPNCSAFEGSRDETRDLGRRQHRREGRGVGRPELAKGDPVPNQRRQGVAPRRGGWRGDDTWRHRREEMLLLHTVLPTRVLLKFAGCCVQVRAMADKSVARHTLRRTKAEQAYSQPGLCGFRICLRYCRESF